ncbi:MAG: DUF503 domain-containing protein [Anaerolineae bacterium]|nr:DUF503 domain-containing protein [Anaerolineae bacterium]
MVIGACTIELELPGVASLKEKRSTLKTLIARLHREFNISAAEVDLQDEWDVTILGISTVSNDAAHAQKWLQNVIEWIEKYRPDLEVVDHYIEVIHFSSSAR